MLTDMEMVLGQHLRYGTRRVTHQLRRGYSELVVVATSGANHCTYCVSHHAPKLAV